MACDLQLNLQPKDGGGGDRGSRPHYVFHSVNLIAPSCSHNGDMVTLNA